MVDVLRFRLTPRTEELVVKRWGSVEEFERYVNGGSKHMFEERYVRHLAGADVELAPSMVMVCGQIKLVIGDPYSWDPEPVPVVKAVVNVSRDDRNKALGHTAIESQVRFLRVCRTSQRRPLELPVERPVASQQERRPRRRHRLKPEGLQQAVDFYPMYEAKSPNDKVAVLCEREREWHWVEPGAKYCPECGGAFPPLPTCPVCKADLVPGRGVYCSRCRHQLPAPLAVPREIAFSIKIKEFTEATQSNVKLVEAIANGLRRGRDERRMILGPVLLIHLELRNERDASTQHDMAKASETLQELDIGTIISDPYELRILRRLMRLDVITSSDGRDEKGSIR
jgi:hypothetical protein